jgi:hypothetical protein
MPGMLAMLPLERCKVKLEMLIALATACCVGSPEQKDRMVDLGVLDSLMAGL